MMVHRSVLIAWLALGVTRAVAAPCAQVSGDEAGAVAELLEARGVTSCPALVARIERRGDALVVSAAPEGTQIERTVDDPATAATVIESWARSDVAAPLLAARTFAIAAPLPAVVSRAVMPPPARGVQLFAAVESSFASDRTSWLGPEIGACVMIGPVCAAARIRFAEVIAGPAPWSHQLDRAGTELLVGGDVPFHIGRATISPGFGGGIGMIRTHVDEENLHMYGETGGLRADVHAALSYPLGAHLALDLTLAIDITEATHVETNTTMPFPDEPWLLARIGAGVRYGGR